MDAGVSVVALVTSTLLNNNDKYIYPTLSALGNVFLHFRSTKMYTYLVRYVSPVHQNR
jgi:hypothetical protein